MTIAVDLRNIRKDYRLYPSYTSMALDWAGYYKVCFWQKPPEFTVKKALNDVSVQIKRGDRVGIIGRNGAGKTTLLKVAAGMVSPTAGKVIVNGRVQVLMRLGAAFHPDFSGAENIRHSLLYNGLRGATLEKAFDEVVDFVELGDFLDQPMRAYSMGMATRLQFAVATAITPDILIIDEVLGAGDAYFAAKSADRMRVLTRSGCTLLLVSHARSQIMEFCTSAIWMDQGKIRQYGELDSVTTAYDKAIAEAISSAETGPLPKDSLGILPIPGHLRHPAYLQRMREAVDTLGTPLSWTDTLLGNAQMEAKAAGSPVLITEVALMSQGEFTNHVSTGQAFHIRLVLERAAAATEKCRMLVFSNGGDLIAMAESPIIKAVTGQGVITINFRELPLAHRDCLLAFVVESNGQVAHVLAGVYLKIIETNDSDPPLLHYPAKWYQNTDVAPAAARISGIQ